MNICVKTGAMMLDNLGRMYPCDLFRVGTAIVIRAPRALADMDCIPTKEERSAASHTVTLDYSCLDRLEDLGFAVVPLGHVTGELLL